MLRKLKLVANIVDGMSDGGKIMFEVNEAHKGLMVLYYFGILDMLGISHPPWKEVAKSETLLDGWYTSASKFRWPVDSE